MIKIETKEGKLSGFLDDTKVYIENPRESTEKTIKLERGFSKRVIQKAVVSCILASSNLKIHGEKPFHISNKKCLRIDLWWNEDKYKTFKK